MDNIKIYDESGDRKYFTIIPNYILNHSTIWDREVYIQMKKITGEDGSCWASRKNLAKQCGISERKLDKSIKYLIEHKWIEKLGLKKVMTKGGPQLLNEYRVLDLWKKNIDFYQNNKGVAPETIPLTERGSTDEAKGIAHGAHKEEPVLIRSINTISTPDFFEVFWSLYPRKVAKPNALKAWRKIKPDNLLVAEILDGLKKHRSSRQWQEDNGRFIPHPATFLNQERWKDEVESKKESVLRL